MVIKDKLVSDLEIRLSKYKPHKDLKINRSLLAFWLDSSRDPLVYQKIIGELSKRNTIDQAFIFPEILNPAATTSDGKYYIETTYPILMLPDDRGITKIRHIDDGYDLIKTDYDKHDDVISNLRYATYSIDRMFFHRNAAVRSGQTLASASPIIIEGADATTVTDQLEVHYVRANWGSDAALTDIYPITSDLIDMLMEAAIQKGMQTLQAGMYDVVNNEIQGE